MLPEAFVNRMKNSLGEEFDDFIASYDHEQYKAIRWNPLKVEESVDELNDAINVTGKVEWEKLGYYIDMEKPGKHPYHEAGAYYIQEPSAMAPVNYLGVEPGDKVLDLCSAPGGKSTQIAGRLKGDGLLICNEPYPQRAKILSENIERLGVRNAIVLNEYPDKLSSIFIEYFDKILVDAPCSGEGMFRKNEDATYEWSEENVTMCAERQLDILNHAAKMLKPGGRIVYSTCTFSEEEDEGVIGSFLENNKEFSICEVEKYPGFEDGNIKGTVRIWPHKVKGEGHFLAVLMKTPLLRQDVEGEKESGRLYDSEELKKNNKKDGYSGYVSNGLQKGLPLKDVKEFIEFAEEVIDINNCMSATGKKLFDDDSIYIKFGDQLHLLPKGSPNLKGLKVERPGLHLGTFKKNRFEPAHALAMALRPSEVFSYVNMSADGNDIGSYINGMTIMVNEGENLDEKEVVALNNRKDYGNKGHYTLMCVDGYSIGWAKNVNGMLKNHYPKGLRKN